MQMNDTYKTKELQTYLKINSNILMQQTQNRLHPIICTKIDSKLTANKSKF